MRSAVVFIMKFWHVERPLVIQSWVRDRKKIACAAFIAWPSRLLFYSPLCDVLVFPSSTARKLTDWPMALDIIRSYAKARSQLFVNECPAHILCELTMLTRPCRLLLLFHDLAPGQREQPVRDVMTFCQAHQYTCERSSKTLAQVRL